MTMHNDKNINPPIKHASNSRASNIWAKNWKKLANSWLWLKTSVLPAGHDKTSKHKIIKYYRDSSTLSINKTWITYRTLHLTAKFIFKCTWNNCQDNYTLNHETDLTHLE